MSEEKKEMINDEDLFDPENEVDSDDWDIETDNDSSDMGKGKRNDRKVFVSDNKEDKGEAPDQRFSGNKKQVKHKKEIMSKFRNDIKKDKRIKWMVNTKNNLKLLFSFDSKSILTKIIKGVIIFLDMILNFVVISSIMAAVILSIKYLYNGNYIMVGAACLYLVTASYISSKIQ